MQRSSIVFLILIVVLGIGFAAAGARVVVAYSDLAPDQLGWTIQTVDSAGDVGQYNSLALDPTSGSPRLSYYDATNGVLKYAAWDGTDWQVEVVDDADDVGQYGSLALDPISGYPRISYYDAVSQTLKYAAWDGDSWQIEVVDDSGDDTGKYCSLALDPATGGDPRISYQRCLSALCCLRYAAWQPAASAWISETVDCEGENTGRYTSLALDPTTGDPRISYQKWKSDGDLRYTAWDGSEWHTDTLAQTGDRGHCSSLALDPDSGYPRIADYYPIVNATLYKAWDGSTWLSGAINYGGSEGYGSLALDETSGPTRGYPRVSHRSKAFTGHKLLYAAWDGANWQEEVVYDTTGVADTSLALDPTTGYPRISFYDEDNGDLKIAIWGESTCTNALDCLQDHFTNKAGPPPNNARSAEWGVYHDYTGQAEKAIVEGGTTSETQMLAFNFEALVCVLRGDCAGRDGTYDYLRSYMLPHDGINDQPHNGPFQPDALSHWLIDIDGGTVISESGSLPPDTPYLAYAEPRSNPPELPDRPAYIGPDDYEYAVAPDADQWWVEGLLPLSANCSIEIF